MGQTLTSPNYGNFTAIFAHTNLDNEMLINYLEE